MQDVRYGVRLLRRQPGIAAVAILTMALGIGATTMLFSVAYGVLLKPLPWSDPAELVRVTETREGRSGRVLGTMSNGTFLAWRDHRSAIEDLGGWRLETATLTGAWRSCAGADHPNDTEPLSDPESSSTNRTSVQ